MASVAHRPAARLQVGVLASLLGLTALAWLFTQERMLGMDAGPGTDPGGLGFYVVSWVVMMSAMMFPSIAPMVLTFRFVQRRKHDRGSVDHVVSTWVFIGGYLVTWTAFGLLAYGLYVGVRSLAIPAFSWHRGGPYLAGGVILAAAIYQLTPLKDACLSRCRAPLDFVLTHWRDGPWGALWMGIVHGGWCVGCCWGLMAALFALGVMSLTWMIAVAGLIAIEKLLPWSRLASRLVAATLAVLAFGVALAPRQLPGLTLPDSPAAQKAMSGMSSQKSMSGMPGQKSMPGMSGKKSMPGVSGQKPSSGTSAQKPMSEMSGGTKTAPAHEAMGMTQK